MGGARGSGSGGSWVPLALLLALFGAATTLAAREERPDSVSVPFTLGSRYGRSRPDPLKMVAPRNDRFFMGSRYGKRAAGERGVAGGRGEWCELAGCGAPAPVDHTPGDRDRPLLPYRALTDPLADGDRWLQ